MSVLAIDQSTFAQQVLASEKPVLVDFWASWCGPCRMLAPVVEKLSEEHPEIRVVKVNVDEAQQLAQRFQVMSIPTLVLFKEGQAVARSVGVKPQRVLEEMIK